MDADERTQLDRREKGDEAAEDAREEYTGYQKGSRPERDRSEEAEADREAELQPDGRKESAGGEGGDAQRQRPG